MGRKVPEKASMGPGSGAVPLTAPHADRNKAVATVLERREAHTALEPTNRR